MRAPTSEAGLLQRPIFGGVFGHAGRYALASMPCISHGLHATRYMVVHPAAGVVVSMSEDKVQALALARQRITAASGSDIYESAPATQFELWPDGTSSTEPDAPSKPKNVSRRRRQIYERSHGMCHYCRAQLELAGTWHVEHQLPRALGGGDDALNLVAACVSCNLAKSDRTALEFVAGTAGIGSGRA